MEMDSALARQPIDTDPQEKAITERLRNAILITDYAVKVLAATRKLQGSFFRKNLSDKTPDNSRTSYLELLDNLVGVTTPKITSGEHHLLNLTDEKGVIIITNHLGIIKLTKIDNTKKEFDVPLPSFEPFPLRHSSFKLISDSLGMSLHESAIELPKPLSDLQKRCQVIIVRAGGQDRTRQLIDDSRSTINYRKAVIVMYPEGGTSGKRNNGGVYDLDHFHTGAFIVAKELEIPVLPITQFFNPRTGFELDILNPIDNESLKNRDPYKIAKESQTAMQKKLNSKLNS